MDKAQKEQLVEDINGRLQKAQGTFLVDYQGLDVEAMNKLRNELRDTGTEIQVAKNRLLKLACKDTETESIIDKFVGPTAIAISYEDVVSPAKVLVGLSKDYKKLDIKYGQISGKPVDVDKIKKLAELPNRDQLLAQTLSVMQAVPISFVRVLNGVTVNLLNVLKAIEEKKN